MSQRANTILRKALIPFLWGTAFLLAASFSARGDVGVVLSEALPTGGDKISSTGHSAVYFSRICPETPVKLRLCREGEHGSVLSNYSGFGETEPFEWNVAPLGVFLYGVENPRQWPLAGSPKIKRIIEDHYREKYLAGYCSQEPCTTSGKADWRYMAGAGLSRSIYIFVAETTVEEDRELIEKFNALPNENHFHAATNNCADFTGNVISTYFPNATHRDVLNDFGLTSPKAMARSFTHYARQHPGLRFHVLHFAQVPGTIRRSKTVREGTEQLYHSPLFAVPLVLTEYALPAAMVSYSVSGRFNPEHEWEQQPSGREAQIAAEMQAAKANHDEAAIQRLEAEQRAERARVVGSDKDWEAYRAQWKAMVDEAVEAGLLPNRKSVDPIFEQIDKSGVPYLDAQQGLWVEMRDGETVERLGLTAGSILAPGSDPQLAYRLLLARAGRILKSPKHRRESLEAFKRDWALLEAARKRNRATPASAKLAAPQRVATADPPAPAAPKNSAAADAPASNIRAPIARAPSAPVIVIGFVGGYVRQDDAVHSVVQLTARLRKDYPSGVSATVFDNHHREAAHQRVLHLLDAGHQGAPTRDEKESARIVIFGFSWGGSETVTLARELEKDGIPVLLTIQVDSVTKRGEDDSVIPANVAQAANFYQSEGWLHGRSQVRAADPAKTQILGNYHFEYKTHPLACAQYPWYDRAFMKVHTEIECDPKVWGLVEGLIRSKLPAPTARPAAG